MPLKRACGACVGVGRAVGRHVRTLQLVLGDGSVDTFVVPDASPRLDRCMTPR